MFTSKRPPSVGTEVSNESLPNEMISNLIDVQFIFIYTLPDAKTASNSRESFLQNGYQIVRFSRATL